MTNSAKSAKRAGLAAGLLAAAVMSGLGIGQLGGLGIGDASADAAPPSLPTTSKPTTIAVYPEPEPTHIVVYPDRPAPQPTTTDGGTVNGIKIGNRSQFVQS